MSIIKPDAGIIFMKVGTHARESLADIIKRKSKEIDEAGYAMWGYGGNSCHPRTMVQPFAKGYAVKNEPIYLCMQEMDSKHFAEPLRASEFSVDGMQWEQIPTEINVRGSRFALLIEDLKQTEIELPLENTRVAIGNSKGRPAIGYIQGQVDKACLEIVKGGNSAPEIESKIIPISLVAKLRPPYAVFLREHH